MELSKVPLEQRLPESKTSLKSSKSKCPAKKKLKVEKKKRQLMIASSAMEELASTVLLHLTLFIEPVDLLRLSISSKCMQSNIDDSIWNDMIQRLCSTPAKILKPRTPRHRVLSTLVEKFTCRGCHEYGMKDLITIRCKAKYYGAKVCRKCYDKPKFQEISYMAAMRQYGLNRKRLMTLESRTVSVSRGYSRLFNLQDVMDEAARSSTT